MAKKYVYAKMTDVEEIIAALVNSAPEDLNTFKELAEALGNDPNYATTVMTKLENKADTAYVNQVIQETILDSWEVEV